MIEQLDMSEMAKVYGGGSGDEKGDEPRHLVIIGAGPIAAASGDEKGDEP